jgi:DNA-binding transcriptional MerR regulator
MSRGNTIRVPDGKITTKTLAEKAGVSIDTIKRWRDASLLPYEIQDNGSLTVYLYGDEAVEVARRLKKSPRRNLTDRMVA